jgi:hypothetical protein
VYRHARTPKYITKKQIRQREDKRDYKGKDKGQDQTSTRKPVPRKPQDSHKTIIGQDKTRKKHDKNKRRQDKIKTRRDQRKKRQHKHNKEITRQSPSQFKTITWQDRTRRACNAESLE